MHEYQPKTEKPKRPFRRTNISDKQRHTLNEAYKINQHPDRETLERLGQFVGLELSVVRERSSKSFSQIGFLSF